MNETQVKEELQLVVFKLGSEEYGVPITQVQEIKRLDNLTRIPNAPDFVEGVMNLRGKILPIIDLKKRFNLDASEITNETRIIVVELSGIAFGVIVDVVSEVLRLPTENIEPPPQMVAGITSEYLTGVGKVGNRLIILLDLNKIFEKEEEEALSTVAVES